ncbi:MAG: hypothetical protein M3Y12_11480 [Bacteroidota bacterium]|nr:hypothetical protein [Bacteroidota bacterium]
MIFFLLVAALQTYEPTASCQAHLEAHAQDGLLTITGHCRNLLPTTERYRYELALRREGPGGSSQNSQRGVFSAASHEEVALSQTQINAGPQDSYRIHLRIFDMAGHILAQDSVTQNSIH